MSDQEMSQEANDEANQAGEGEADTSDTGMPAMDEMALLKSRARMLNITFSNNIGLEALKQKVNDKLKSAETAEDAAEEDNDEEEEAPQEQNELEAPEPALQPAVTLNPLAGDTAGQAPTKTLSKRDKIRREAMKLVRCRITNLDPKKKDLPGEIFCVGNKYIGTVKKFIPYGAVTDDGYHIPKVLFDELESRKFLHIRTGKNKQNGQIQVDTSYAKEFAIEVLPMLTHEQLAKLASAQLASNNA